MTTDQPEAPATPPTTATPKPAKAPKNCTCLDKIRKALEEEHGEGNVCLQLKPYMNFATGILSTDLPPLFFKIRQKNAKGKPTSKWKQSHIKFTHCPFCGQPRS